jgi:hypothetical protein
MNDFEKSREIISMIQSYIKLAAATKTIIKL